MKPVVLIQSGLGYWASDFEKLMFFACPHVSFTLLAVGFIWHGDICFPCRRAFVAHGGILGGSGVACRFGLRYGLCVPFEGKESLAGSWAFRERIFKTFHSVSQ